MATVEHTTGSRALEAFYRHVPLCVRGDAIAVDDAKALNTFQKGLRASGILNKSDWTKSLALIEPAIERRLRFCREHEPHLVKECTDQLERMRDFKANAERILKDCEPATEIQPDTIAHLFSAYKSALIESSLVEYGRIPVVSAAGITTGEQFIMVSPGQDAKQEEFTSKKALFMNGYSEDYLKVDIQTLANFEYMRRSLVRAGAEVKVVDGETVDGDDREIFPRDAVLILGERAFPLADEYFGEQKALAPELMSKGKKIVPVKANCAGGNLVYDSKRDVIYMGRETASKDIFLKGAGEEDRKALEIATGKTVLPIALKSYDYYHLDTFLSVLPGGEVLIDPAGTDQASFEMIKRLTPPQDLKVIDDREHELKTNIVAVANTLLVNAMDDETKRWVTERGYNVIIGKGEAGDTGREFRMWDGGIRCATLKCTQDKQPGWRKENAIEANEKIATPPHILMLPHCRPGEHRVKPGNR